MYECFHCCEKAVIWDADWMMIRANSTYFFYLSIYILYIIYVISLGTKNENAVTQLLQWIPHFWYLTVVIYYIL